MANHTVAVGFRLAEWYFVIPVGRRSLCRLNVRAYCGLCASFSNFLRTWFIANLVLLCTCTQQVEWYVRAHMEDTLL
jgi:hypothetical protein